MPEPRDRLAEGTSGSWTEAQARPRNCALKGGLKRDSRRTGSREVTADLDHYRIERKLDAPPAASRDPLDHAAVGPADAEGE
jgi:hypothetical protein